MRSEEDTYIVYIVWIVPEAAPLDVACSPLSSQSVKVSWSPPPVNQHGGLLQGYKVIYKPVLKDNSKSAVFRNSLYC